MKSQNGEWMSGAQAGLVWDELVDVSEILEAFRPWAENGEDRRHGLESCRRPAAG